MSKKRGRYEAKRENGSKCVGRIISHNAAVIWTPISVNHPFMRPLLWKTSHKQRPASLISDRHRRLSTDNAWCRASLR